MYNKAHIVEIHDRPSLPLTHLVPKTPVVPRHAKAKRDASPLGSVAIAGLVVSLWQGFTLECVCYGTVNIDVLLQPLPPRCNPQARS